MIVQHELTAEKFLEAARAVTRDLGFPDSTVRFYVFLAGLENGYDFREMFLQKTLNMGRNAIVQRKKDLKKAGMLIIEEIERKKFMAFIGSPTQPASEVQANWHRAQEEK